MCSNPLVTLASPAEERLDQEGLMKQAPADGSPSGGVQPAASAGPASDTASGGEAPQFSFPQFDTVDDFTDHKFASRTEPAQNARWP